MNAENKTKQNLCIDVCIPVPKQKRVIKLIFCSRPNFLLASAHTCTRCMVSVTWAYLELIFGFSQRKHLKDTNQQCNSVLPPFYTLVSETNELKLFHFPITQPLSSHSLTLKIAAHVHVQLGYTTSVHVYHD